MALVGRLRVAAHPDVAGRSDEKTVEEWEMLRHLLPEVPRDLPRPISGEALAGGLLLRVLLDIGVRDGAGRQIDPEDGLDLPLRREDTDLIPAADTDVDTGRRRPDERLLAEDAGVAPARIPHPFLAGEVTEHRDHVARGVRQGYRRLGLERTLRLVGQRRPRLRDEKSFARAAEAVQGWWPGELYMEASRERAGGREDRDPIVRGIVDEYRVPRALQDPAGITELAGAVTGAPCGGQEFPTVVEDAELARLPVRDDDPTVPEPQRIVNASKGDGGVAHRRPDLEERARREPPPWSFRGRPGRSDAMRDSRRVPHQGCRFLRESLPVTCDCEQGQGCRPPLADGEVADRAISRPSPTVHVDHLPTGIPNCDRWAGSSRRSRTSTLRPAVLLPRRRWRRIPGPPRSPAWPTASRPSSARPAIHPLPATLAESAFGSPR